MKIKALLYLMNLLLQSTMQTLKTLFNRNKKIALIKHRTHLVVKIASKNSAVQKTTCCELNCKL